MLSTEREQVHVVENEQNTGALEAIVKYHRETAVIETRIKLGAFISSLDISDRRNLAIARAKDRAADRAKRTGITYAEGSYEKRDYTNAMAWVRRFKTRKRLEKDVKKVKGLMKSAGIKYGEDLSTQNQMNMVAHPEPKSGFRFDPLGRDPGRHHWVADEEVFRAPRKAENHHGALSNIWWNFTHSEPITTGGFILDFFHRSIREDKENFMYYIGDPVADLAVSAIDRWRQIGFSGSDFLRMGSLLKARVANAGKTLPMAGRIAVLGAGVILVSQNTDSGFIRQPLEEALHVPGPNLVFKTGEEIAQMPLSTAVKLAMDRMRDRSGMMGENGNNPSIASSGEVAGIFQRTGDIFVGDNSPAGDTKVEVSAFDAFVNSSVEIKPGDTLGKITELLIPQAENWMNPQNGVKKSHVIADMLAKFAQKNGVNLDLLRPGERFSMEFLSEEQKKTVADAFDTESIENYIKIYPRVATELARA